ncbi:hypothetical protein JJB11_03010 [Ramlibacter ginsenosidimutans]|uniref:Cell wall anchor protein n=1 Tax=Ramlibacter ginsenosidimutans TaxID=502333 RepID=A0A934TPF1_9BURK|nr:hypothetical protein [Ramlibacter ginsenosidimutans]MBK6005052.1 hypothetical protein [Ramlibacter ginsenosidimutans]
MHFSRKSWGALVAGSVLLIAGCGGGGGSGTTPAPAAAQLVGTAAVGSALGNAPVTITNAAGNSPCQESSITTTPLGSYTCTLKSGETAPFFVVVTDPTGNTPPLVSISTSTPKAGATLTVNATPLTTAIVAQLGGGDALSVVKGRTVDASQLAAITANVVQQLSQVLAAIGAPANYDPFSTSITAATAGNTGNTADMVLDVVKVVSDPATGQLALSTVDNPTPVLLATATSAGGTVSAPDPAVSTLSQGTQIAARAFTDCFALPTAQRVLHTTARAQSDGGPEVDQVGAACENLAADTSNAAGVDYLHNGYYAGQHFYNLLTADRMTGATFSVPEIVAFYPKSTTATAPSPAAYDRAVLNIRYVDSAGNPGNVITMAAKLPGTSSATRSTEWWLVGNQQPVDASVQMVVRRIEQMNPANTTKFSNFVTGFLLNVNNKGPGSIDSTQGAMSMARISGPGLPGNGAAGTGLVFAVSTNPDLPALDLFNKTGSLTTGTLCGNGSTSNCPLVWIGRTKGLTGTDATTLATNPNAMLWAQPADGFDVSKFVKGAQYKLELFYGTSTSPKYTMTKTLLTDFVAPTSLVNLPWNTLGPKSLAALDPNGSLAGAQTSLPLDWVQNPSAQQVTNVAAVFDAFGSYGPSQPVDPGATSTVLNATVPAFTLTNPPSRTLKFNYRMTDGSIKSTVYQYN